MGISKKPRRATKQRPQARSARPALEGLEDRLLLYAANGGHWVYGTRITYSLVPDGTSVGGVPSNMFSTLNHVAPTSTWQSAIEQAAALWSTYANVNMSLVSDNGTAIGGGPDQQGDPNMGDIRVAMIPLGLNGPLAYTLLPPPINGGSDAGDIVINSSLSWQVSGTGSGYDLETVAIHELGHALGMDHSSLSNAVMYAYYNGIKQTLTTDDVNGIQSVYGAYPTNPATNRSFGSAMNLNGLLTSQLQVTLSSGQWLDGSSGGFYYLIGVPGGGTGSMTVSMQSAALSSVSPKLVIYNSSKQGLATVSLPSSYGAVAQYTVNNVVPGSYYYIMTTAASGAGSVGTYGLLINFGPSAQYWVSPPYTLVTAQPDQGGGSEPIQQGAGQVTGNPLLDQLVNPLVNPWPGAVTRYLKVNPIFQSLQQTLDGADEVHLGNLTAWADALTASQYQSARSQFVVHSPAATGMTFTAVTYLAPPALMPLGTHDAALSHWEGYRPAGNTFSPVARWVRNQGVPTRPWLAV
jgi:hypothetical protein